MSDDFYDDMMETAEEVANKSKYSDPLLPNQVGEGIVTKVEEVKTQKLGKMFVLNFEVTSCTTSVEGAPTHKPGDKLAYKQAYVKEGAKDRVVKTWLNVAGVPKGVKKDELKQLFAATVGSDQVLVGQRLRFETGPNATSKKTGKPYINLTLIGVQNTPAERAQNRKMLQERK